MDGGAVSNARLISYSTFINNKAEYSDGSGNLCSGSGDALYADTNCTVINSTFYSDENRFTYGNHNLIYVYDSTEVNLVNSIVVGPCYVYDTATLNAWYSVIKEDYVNGEYVLCKNTDDAKAVFEWDEGNDQPVFVTAEVDGVKQTAIKILEKSFAHTQGKFVWHDEEWNNIAISDTGDENAEKTAIIGNADSATELIVKDQLGQDIDIMVPANSIGAYYMEIVAEDKSLTVSTNLDVVNSFDYVTSLREALIYANELATGKNGETITVTFDLDDENIVIDNEFVIGSNLSGNTLQIGTNWYNKEASISVKQGSDSRIFRFGDENDTVSVWDIGFRGLTLSGGNVTGKGGLVFIQGAEITLDIDNCYFKNASISEDGGAIYSCSSGKQYIEIDYSYFSANTAGNGGALAVISGADLDVKIASYSNSAAGFDNNIAQKNGGAIYVKGPNYGKGAAHIVIGTQDYGALFNNNSAGIQGGAIYAEDFNQNLSIHSSLVIKNGSFYSNTATYHGGAVSLYGSGLWDVEISSWSEFNGNKTVGIIESNNLGTYDHCGGGAVSVKCFLGTFSLTGSKFINNTTNYQGGALYITPDSLSASSTVVNISGCTFTGNYAGMNGGALYATNNDGPTVHIKDSSFSDNEAGGSGGAIALGDYFLGSKNWLIENSTFTNNEAAEGGAIGLVYGTNWNSRTTADVLTIVNCSFVENVATGNGGAIGVLNLNGEQREASLTLVNSTFYENSAAAGGAIAMSSSGGAKVELFLVNSTLIQNQGGGILFSSSNGDSRANLLNTIVFDNKLNGANSDIVADNSNQLNFLYSLVGTANVVFSGIGNRTANAVSDIFETDAEGKVVKTNYTPVLKSNSIAQGGGVYVWHDANWSNIARSVKSDSSGKQSFKGSASEANILLTQDKNGNAINTELPNTSMGAYYLGQTLIDINDVTVTITSKVYDGTDVVNTENAELKFTVNGEEFGISWEEGFFNSANVLDVATATFTGLVSLNNNYALDADTITVAAKNMITARNITVKADDKSKNMGEADPALTYTLTAGTLVQDDPLTLSRTPGESAGIYDISLDTADYSNYAITYEGAKFYIKELPSLVVTTTADVVSATDGVTSLREAINYANSKAGADTITFAVDGTFKFDSEITISSDMTITGNGTSKTVFDGQESTSFFTINGGETVEISGITFQNGYATAIYSYHCDLTIVNSAFVRNSSSSSGGAIYITGKTLTIVNSCFEENSAGLHGGAICIGSATQNVTISNTIFSRNFAYQDGGGIYMSSSSAHVVINNSSFIGNSCVNSGFGGALYIYYARSVVINNSTFVDNSATRGIGSAIYNYQRNLTITNSTFSANISDYNGYTIYMVSNTSRTLNLVNNIFVGNGTSKAEEVYGDINVDVNNIYSSADVTVANTFAEVENGKAVLNADGTVHIKAGGSAHGKGVYVWHNEDYSAIAYSADYAGTDKTAVVGSVAEATILSKDQLGNERSEMYTDVGAVLCDKGYLVVDSDSAWFNCTVQEQTYNGTNKVESAVIKFTVDGTEVFLTWNEALFNSANVGEATSATFTGLVSLNPDYFLSSDTVTVNFQNKITAKKVSVEALTVNSKEYDGTTHTAIESFRLNGVLDGETVGLRGNAAFADKNASSSKNFTVTGMTLAGAGAGNYVLVSDVFNGTGAAISAKELVVTADAASKVYGSADPVLTYTAEGLVRGDTLAGSLERTAGENVGTYDITMGTLANSNYTISFNGAKFTITPRNITVKADNLTKLAGSSNPVLTWSVTGLVGNDTLSGSLERVQGEEVGSYEITQGTLGQSDGNYKITFVPGSLTIVPVPAPVPEPVESENNFVPVANEVTSQSTVIMGTLLYNDGKGSAYGDIYTMAYPELVSMELKRTLNKLDGSGELKGIDNRSISSGSFESKEMTLDNVTVGLSSHLSVGMAGAENFAAGREISIGNAGKSGAFTFKDAVKLPGAFFNNEDDSRALAKEYDIPVMENVEVTKVAAFKSEIEKLIDEMLV